MASTLAFTFAGTVRSFGFREYVLSAGFDTEDAAEFANA